MHKACDDGMMWWLKGEPVTVVSSLRECLEVSGRQVAIFVLKQLLITGFSLVNSRWLYIPFRQAM